MEGEVCQSLDFTLVDYSGKSFPFDDVESLLRFFDAEINFWKNISSGIQIGNDKIYNIIDFHNYISNVACDLKSVLGSDSEYISYNEIKKKYLNVQILNQFRINWLWSGHSYIYQFVGLLENQGKETATTFLNYVSRDEIPQIITDKKLLRGIVAGYEYENQDSSLNLRGLAERVSIDQIKDQFLSEKEDALKEFNEIKISCEKWLDEEKENILNFRKKTMEPEFKALIDGSDLKLQSLKNKYQEELRLAKPAEYWAKSAKRYALSGGLWVLSLIFCLVMGYVYFSISFSSWLMGKDMAMDLGSLQGVAIFAVIVASYAFLIRVLSRLTFSSFHLMRDSQERDQLTYLYLSLINENSVDRESRNIILQSLFSRTETGLLSGDSGPTMPSIVDILKVNQR